MIVFDSSTLILLSKTDLLELFISSFHGKVLIPLKVKKEVCIEKKEETPLILKLINEKKIKVLEAKNKKLVKKLMDDFNIDSGEAETLALAMQEGASIVATDDKNAIRACKFLKLDFFTAIAVLIRSFEKKLINEEEAIVKLQKLNSIGRYSWTIIDDAMKKIKEV